MGIFIVVFVLGGLYGFALRWAGHKLNDRETWVLFGLFLLQGLLYYYIGWTS